MYYVCPAPPRIWNPWSAIIGFSTTIVSVAVVVWVTGAHYECIYCACEPVCGVCDVRGAVGVD